MCDCRGVTANQSKNMKTYSIRYQSSGDRTATSMRSALRQVRQTAGVARLARVTVPDGTYCYTSRADMRRDGDGSRAFAVICQPEAA